MEATSPYAERKQELEERIKAFEAEKTRLTAEVAALKEKLETLQLQRKANTLEGEVAALRAEKTTLEEEVAHYTSQEQPTVETAAPEAPQIQASTN